jgi:hypothetical protein
LAQRVAILHNDEVPGLAIHATRGFTLKFRQGTKDMKVRSRLTL